MIVCVCNGVSERQVQNILDSGALNIEDLHASGIGDRCGMCVGSLESMLDARGCSNKCAGCPEKLMRDSVTAA
jgi:bacterioferritin-associated ferredoxin